MDLKETYDKIADKWHEEHAQYDSWVPGLDKFASYLDQGASILDVGCGPGIQTSYLTKKGFKVTGIDFSKEMIRIASDKTPEAVFEMMDILDIDKLEGKFDAIVMQAVLLHIKRPDIEALMGKIRDKFKTGGYIYIATKERLENGPDEEIVTDEYGQRFFSYFTVGEIKKYFSNINLEIIYENISKWGTRNWIEIIGRKS